MKKLAFLLALILSLSCLAAALAEAPATWTLTDIPTKRLGAIEGPFDLMGDEYLAISGVDILTTAVFVPTYSELVAALQSERADYALFPTSTAQFFLNACPEFIMQPVPNFKANFQMLLRSKDEALLLAINEAIVALKEDGTIAELQNKFVYSFDEATAIGVKETKKIDGADTIYVGVSGEQPPLDYVTADGLPAGYNVELVAAIAEKIGKNIVFVIIPSQAKYSALASERIDVFFWHTDLAALPEDIAGTEPYTAFGMYIVHK